MKKQQLSLLVAALIIIGVIFYLESGKVSKAPLGQYRGEDDIVITSQMDAKERIQRKEGKYERAKEITTPDGFINLPEGQKSLQLADLIGKKVILIDFWTYSCINCQRTTPYLNAWYQKYRDQGLEIVGIHTPEFDFEKDYQNVLAATRKEDIQFPVVLDNDYSTWRAYENRFWPRKYLIDIDGFIVYDHIGEGGYEETEAMIQKALKERAQVLEEKTEVATGNVSPRAETSEAKSPETYFGALRNSNFVSGPTAVVGLQNFVENINIQPNMLYLVGQWQIDPEYAETGPAIGGSAGSARINYRYQAKGVYFVVGARDEKPITVEILRDSKPLPSEAAGSDVFYQNGRSYVTIKENRLYRLIDDRASEEHFLELIIPQSGLQAYTFTFG